MKLIILEKEIHNKINKLRNKKIHSVYFLKATELLMINISTRNIYVYNTENLTGNPLWISRTPKLV